VPVTIPPGSSLPLPPVGVVGTISGLAFPSGNGKDLARFAAEVISTPFDVLGVIDALGPGGYGIERIAMPEPVGESSPPPGIVDGGYYAMGYSAGYMESDDSADL